MNTAKFKQIPIDKSSIDKYKNDYKGLKHLRVNVSTKGVIVLDDDNFVGYINTQKKEDGVWIQGFEIYAPYKGQGLSKYFLDIACKKFHATKLGVSKKNPTAIHIYKKYGFKVYEDFNTGYFMELGSSIKESFLEESTKQKLYFLSSKGNLSSLQPRVPDNYMTKNGYEDNTTKRICFGRSIKGCLRALSSNISGDEFYIYSPIGNYEVYTPTEKEVPDCKLTGEVWILDPVKVECIGKIRVSEAKDQPLYYTYGNNKSADLYDWEYEYISESSSTKNDFKKYEINDPKVKKYLENDSYCKKYMNYFKDNTGEVIIDTDKDTIIGYVFVGKSKDKGFISTLEVKPEYRRQGFGDMLLTDAVKKYGAVDLVVVSSNKAAINLYKKHGFTIIDDKQKHEGKPAYWMKRTKSVNEAATITEVMYHGSNRAITNGYLIPDNRSFEDGNYVFGSPYREFALFFAGKPWNSGDFKCGSYNNKIYIVELQKGNLKKFFDTKGYIYTANAKDFEVKRSSLESLSFSKVKILYSEEIDNIYTEIFNSNIDVYKYPEKPSWLKNNVTFSNQFKDVKNVVDSLTDKELHHICTGKFIDSPYIVYRKVVIIDNDPAAFVDVYSIPSEMDKDEAVVVCACKKKYRGKGLIKFCMDGMISILKSKGIKKLYWETSKDNIASSKLAKSLGFVKSKDINRDDDNYELKL